MDVKEKKGEDREGKAIKGRRHEGHLPHQIQNLLFWQERVACQHLVASAEAMTLGLTTSKLFLQKQNHLKFFSREYCLVLYGALV